MNYLSSIDYLSPIAIIPVYDSNGNNSTHLIFEDGKETVITMPIDRFIDGMHSKYRLSYSDNARWASSYLHERTTPPILLDAHHVFLRCQTRKKVTKGHGCYACVSLFAVDKIESTTISLLNGIKIPTCSTSKQLIKHFHHASQIHCFYSSTQDPSRTLPLHTDHLLQDLSRLLRKHTTH